MTEGPCQMHPPTQGTSPSSDCLLSFLCTFRWHLLHSTQLDSNCDLVLFSY